MKIWFLCLLSLVPFKHAAVHDVEVTVCPDYAAVLRFENALKSYQPQEGGIQTAPALAESENVPAEESPTLAENVPAEVPSATVSPEESPTLTENVPVKEPLAEPLAEAAAEESRAAASNSLAQTAPAGTESAETLEEGQVQIAEAERSGAEPQSDGDAVSVQERQSLAAVSSTPSAGEIPLEAETVPSETALDQPSLAEGAAEESMKALTPEIVPEVENPYAVSKRTLPDESQTGSLSYSQNSAEFPNPAQNRVQNPPQFSGQTNVPAGQNEPSAGSYSAPSPVQFASAEEPALMPIAQGSPAAAVPPSAETPIRRPWGVLTFFIFLFLLSLCVNVFLGWQLVELRKIKVR